MKILLSTISFLLFLFFDLAAQSADWKWAIKNGGTNQDYYGCISTDKEGNIYQAGSFTSKTAAFGDIQLQNKGSKALYFIKYDASGEVLWAQTATSSSIFDFGVTDIWCDSKGNVFVTGYFSDTLNIGNTVLTDQLGAMFIFKMNSEGRVLWKTSHSDPGNACYGNKISGDTMGNIYIAGGYNGSTQFTIGNTTFQNQGSLGSNDNFIAKYDSTGAIKWVKNIAGNSVDFLNSLSTDSKGNIYLAGETFSTSLIFGDTTLYNKRADQTTTDLFIAKYNSSGDLLWAKMGGSQDYDDAKDIKVMEDGSVLIIGSFSGSHLTINQTQILGNGSCANTFIIKFDSKGKIIWSKSFGNSTNNYGLSICFDSEKNVYAGGDYYGSCFIENQHLTSNGYNDLFLVKYNSEGQFEQMTTYGGEYWDRLGKIQCDMENNLIVFGDYSSKSIALGNNKLTNYQTDSTFDVYISKIKFNNTNSLGLSNLNSGPDTKIVYPNPFTSYAIVEIPDHSENPVLTLSDATGTLVYTKEVEEKRVTLYRENLPAGIYTLKILSANKVIMLKKLIIE